MDARTTAFLSITKMQKIQNTRAEIAAEVSAETESHCQFSFERKDNLMSCSTSSLTTNIKHESEVGDGLAIATLCSGSFLCDGTFCAADF